MELPGNSLKTQIMLLNSFGENEIGSRITTNYIALHSGISVRQAMHELIEQTAHNDNISTIYVLDENEIFAGAIDLKDLILLSNSLIIKDTLRWWQSPADTMQRNLFSSFLNCLFRRSLSTHG